MSLTLHSHPLSSFCWKTLIALYENDVPFTPNLVDLGNPAERDALLKLWPIGRFPVLEDGAQGRSFRNRASSSNISTAIIQAARDSFPMSRPRLADPVARPLLRSLCPSADAEDHGRPASPRWQAGSPRRRGGAGAVANVLRDDRQQCPAAPWRWATISALPIAPRRPRCSTAAWWCRSATGRKTSRLIFARLKARPSFARVLKEAEPYFGMVPKEG